MNERQIGGLDLAAANQKRSVTPDEVLLTYDADEVEFCSPLGEVKAKSGWGNMGEPSIRATLKKRAAALGANTVLLRGIYLDFVASGSGEAHACTDENRAKQREKAAEIARKAAEPILCTAGVECEVKGLASRFGFKIIPSGNFVTSPTRSSRRKVRSRRLIRLTK